MLGLSREVSSSSKRASVPEERGLVRLGNSLFLNRAGLDWGQYLFDILGHRPSCTEQRGGVGGSI